jgi:pimeloyl-ACP methyl ester carboxylesterase
MDLEVNGVHLHYETFGEGEPLLWLSGFMGVGADWRYLFKEPPPGYCLVAPDLRGHGASTGPSGPFRFRAAAEDLLGLVAHLGLERVKAIGLSGGGITLLHMATLAPALIDAMVLVSAPPYFPEQARVMQRQMSAALLGEAEMARMRERHTRGESQIQQLLEQARTLADTYDDVSFTPPYLSTITARTLIVFGDRDPLYPVSLALDLHSAIPASHLWVVPNGGHGPIFGDRAPLFTETALAFLRDDWRLQAGVAELS